MRGGAAACCCGSVSIDKLDTVGSFWCFLLFGCALFVSVKQRAQKLACKAENESGGHYRDHEEEGKHKPLGSSSSTHIHMQENEADYATRQNNR